MEDCGLRRWGAGGTSKGAQYRGGETEMSLGDLRDVDKNAYECV